MTSPADAVAALYASPTSTCDWAIEQCHMIGLPPKKCERFGCLKYLHHVCSIQWAAKNNLPEDGIATLCRAHHPQYKKYVTAAAATVSTASDTITGGVISPPMPASMDLTDILDDAFISRTDDHDEPPHPSLLSPAERHFVDNNRTMLSLVTMCIGAVDDDGLQLIDPDAEPWDKYPKKHVKPASDILRAEIKRRWSAYSNNEGKEPASKIQIFLL